MPERNCRWCPNYLPAPADQIAGQCGGARLSWLVRPEAYPNQSSSRTLERFRKNYPWLSRFILRRPVDCFQSENTTQSSPRGL